VPEDSTAGFFDRGASASEGAALRVSSLLEMTFCGRFPFYIQVKMSRVLRFVPEGGALVEVTVRTVHARLLLLPGGDINRHHPGRARPSPTSLRRPLLLCGLSVEPLVMRSST
jgi:hypothetical protein